MLGNTLANSLSTSIRIPKSINHVKENLNKPEEEVQNKNATIEVEESPVSQQAFTLAQLTNVWHAYAENLKSKGQINHHMVLTSTALDLKEDYGIHITVGNAVQMDQLEEIKVEFLSHLRRALKNNALRIHAVIGYVAPKEKKFFTDDDKLKMLMEHYPVVAELRKKLGLEINY